MTLDWTYELLSATGLIILALGITTYWAKSIKKTLFLIFGFIGFWLAIAKPSFIIELDKEATEVRSILDFLSSERASMTDTVYLIGNEHDLQDLTLLKEFQIIHKENNVERGFDQIIIPEAIVEGSSFKIDGKFHADIDTTDKVWLELDERLEATLSNDGSFQIPLVAPVKGLYEYNLAARMTNGDTIVETLPIQVEPASKLSMLMIGSSPQFDLNYLKNYWASQGHSIVQKVKISKEKYSTSFVNFKEINLSNLSSNVLDQFDIVYLDIPAWNGLSSGERSRLLASVRDKGLGLILRPMNVGESALSIRAHDIAGFADVEINSVTLSTSVINAGNPWRKISYGRTYKTGLGEVFLLGINDSYKLILNDESDSYQDLWSGIFSELFVQLVDGISVDHRFLIYESESSNIQLNYIVQDETYELNEDEVINVNYTPLLDGYGNARIIGRKGWNYISKQGSNNKAWFYLHEKGSWKSMKAKNAMNYVAYLQNVNEHQQVNYYKVQKEIPWWISILMMVFGFGMVWIIEKMR